MPFDPKAYLAKKQTQVASQTGSESAPAFDPKAYLDSKNGPQTDLPNAEPGAAAKVMNAADQAVPVAETYGQGAALGYGSQLNAGIQAAAGAVDQTVNGSNAFGDQSATEASYTSRLVDAISNLPKNYTRAKTSVNEQIDKARSSHPVASALAEITGSIAPTYLAGQGLAGLGVESAAAQAPTIAGAYGYGSSRNEGTSRIEDAGKAAVAGYALAKAVPLAGAALSAIKEAPNAIADLAASEYADYGAPIVSIAKAAVKETPYGLDFQPKLGEAFQIGKEMKGVLTDPKTQGEVAEQLNAQPGIISKIIAQTKENLGKLWEPLMTEHGDITTKSDPILNKAYNTAKDIATEGDEVAGKLQEALFNKVTGFATSLKPTDNIMQTGGEASLRQLSEAQEALGSAIWRDKQFSKAPGVERAAKKIWGQLADAASSLDETKGSGGQMRNINDVFKAMYGMEENMLDGPAIKAMVNPKNVRAVGKFQDFVKPFEDLSPDLRHELAPEMHSYLADNFPKVFAKVKTMVAATTNGDSGLINKILNTASLRGLKAINIANRAGQMSNISYSGPSISGAQIAAPAQTALSGTAPSIAGQAAGGPQH